MKGSIRFFLGLLLTFGAVGGMEAQPDANLALQLLAAGAGLALMFWATKSMQNG
jgi:hypothetical protein